jgi:glutamate N-acetyltransferase / amino-acid N-acetyltransferase
LLNTVFDGTVTTPQGFHACGVRCGLKEKGLDLAMVYSTVTAAAAALFTTNKIKAAPVTWSQALVPSAKIQAMIINSGNANACTGVQGDQDALEMALLTGNELALAKEAVLVASTGIIGKPMAMDKVRAGIPLAKAALSADGGLAAAQAIMTTDLVAKHFAITCDIGASKARIGVMAKGSGMINPNLATMICCVTTDVAITPEMLDKALRAATAESLNSLTVDGEMSTNDCVLAMANGMCGNTLIEQTGAEYDIFVQALQTVMQAVARQIAEDGEGATKLALITIEQAASKAEAMRAAKAVANSMLVKTALFGQDPNWGRVVSAVGGSGVQLDPNHIAVSFAGITVLQNGQPVPFDLTAMKNALAEKEIKVRMSLAAGSASATVFSCDLTYDYVKINAEYHT